MWRFYWLLFMALSASMQLPYHHRAVNSKEDVSYVTVENLADTQARVYSINQQSDPSKLITKLKRNVKSINDNLGRFVHNIIDIFKEDNNVNDRAKRHVEENELIDLIEKVVHKFVHKAADYLRDDKKVKESPNEGRSSNYFIPIKNENKGKEVEQVLVIKQNYSAPTEIIPNILSNANLIGVNDGIDGPLLNTEIIPNILSTNANLTGVNDGPLLNTGIISNILSNANSTGVYDSSLINTENILSNANLTGVNDGPLLNTEIIPNILSNANSIGVNDSSLINTENILSNAGVNDGPILNTEIIPNILSNANSIGVNDGPLLNYPNLNKTIISKESNALLNPETNKIKENTATVNNLNQIKTTDENINDLNPYRYPKSINLPKSQRHIKKRASFLEDNTANKFYSGKRHAQKLNTNYEKYWNKNHFIKRHLEKTALKSMKIRAGRHPDEMVANREHLDELNAKDYNNAERKTREIPIVSDLGKIVPDVLSHVKDIVGNTFGGVLGNQSVVAKIEMPVAA